MAGSFIGFEIDIPRISSNTIKDVRILFYISVHKDLMRSKFRSGIRTDLIANEIDKTMNGDRDFGIGRCELEAIERFRTQERFYGRLLAYKIKDFNSKEGGL